MVWLLPTAAMLSLALAFEYSPLDRMLVRPFFDAGSGGFPLRHHWMFDGLLHVLGKWFVLLTAIIAGLSAIAGWFLPRLRPWRWTLLYMAMCAGLTSGVVAILKAVTNRYPPWSMIEFGGSVPYTPLFSGTPEPFIGGRGFPAGHASGILAWVSLWFVARSWKSDAPAWWLFPVAAGGALFGWTQHVRGAHFPSHNLWTLAVAWTVATALAAIFSRAGVLPQAPAASARSCLEPRRTVPIRSWLIGVGGLFVGCLLFAVGTAVELLGWGPDILHF